MWKDVFVMAWVFVACMLTAMLVFGCAASPDTLIYVEKNVYIMNNTAPVKSDYAATAEIKSDAKLDGTVTPTTTVTVTPVP